MDGTDPTALRLVWWGTYDLGKPRTRILLRGLRELGVDVIECHADVWGGIEDKSMVASWRRRAALAWRWLSSYPALLWRYLRLPPHDAVVVGYPGQLDVLLIKPLAWLRGAPVVLDVVQSLFATVVVIRRMAGRRHPIGRLLYAWEWLAFHAADRAVFVSRYAAGDYARQFGLARERTEGVPIGVEPECFPPRPAGSPPDPEAPFTVLFYGTFHKLHGVDTIVEAARRGRLLPVRWVLVGDGQEGPAIRASLERDPLDNVEWIPWVPYAQLVDWLHRADAALGLIGRSDHSGWAVPNKTMQILHAGVPLISADTPAVRELLGGPRPGVVLIPPGDSAALLAAVQTLRAQRAALWREPLHRDIAGALAPRAVAADFLAILAGARGAAGANRGAGSPSET